jgi:Domain of unknown function (DUF6249)
MNGFAALMTAGALLCCAAPRVLAGDETNAPASPAKHGLNLQFNVGSEESSATNYYGLPKEAFDKLTPQEMIGLAKSSQPPAEMIVFVSLGMFAMIVGCVALGVSQRLKRARLMHDTLRLMIEKGQPIPPELLQSPDGIRRPRNDLRNGLVLIGIGIGLVALLLADHDHDWPVALIPLLIGVAFLIARKVEPNQNGRSK